ncbi:hypothetical protein GCM10010129_40940 [Streptomyces fumigatiscleroticus]|nr:hypothetical protein GCM10010129_40940 [Streptomyces fumigatiscleroticus]
MLWLMWAATAVLTGTGRGDGSRLRPYGTLSAAVRAARPGDAIEGGGDGFSFGGGDVPVAWLTSCAPTPFKTTGERASPTRTTPAGSA